MKKQVLVLGPGGMLGHMVLEVLRKSSNFDTISVGSERFNAAHDAPFFSLNYNYVINCIGIIKPYIKDNNAAEVERAIAVNALFPHKLPRFNPQATIIQIATDCIVQGNIPEDKSYDESLISDATDVYGKTKALGEVTSSNFHNIRCSIIGPEMKNHKSLFDWFLSQKDDAKLNGFTNHYWNGVTTLAFAKVVVGIIENDIKLPNFHHLVPTNSVNKFELLNIFKDTFEKTVDITPAKAQTQVNRKLSTLNAPLNISLWKAAGYKNVPEIKELVGELKEIVTKRQKEKEINQRETWRI